MSPGMEVRSFQDKTTFQRAHKLNRIVMKPVSGGNPHSWKVQQRQHSEQKNVFQEEHEGSVAKGAEQRKDWQRRGNTGGVIFYSGMEIYANIAVKISGKKMREVISLQESASCNLISVPCYTKSNKKKCSINAPRRNELTNSQISQLYNSVSRHSEPSHCKE